jgi:hypothetical protein
LPSMSLPRKSAASEAGEVEIPAEELSSQPS